MREAETVTAVLSAAGGAALRAGAVLSDYGFRRSPPRSRTRRAGVRGRAVEGRF